MSSSNINQQNCIFGMADTFYEVPLYWIESAIHPAGSALPVTAHVVVHLHAQGRMVL